jgi:hypothetical protein
VRAPELAQGFGDTAHFAEQGLVGGSFCIAHVLPQGFHQLIALYSYDNTSKMIYDLTQPLAQGVAHATDALGHWFALYSALVSYLQFVARLGFHPFLCFLYLFP